MTITMQSRPRRRPGRVIALGLTVTALIGPSVAQAQAPGCTPPAVTMYSQMFLIDHVRGTMTGTGWRSSNLMGDRYYREALAIAVYTTAQKHYPCWWRATGGRDASAVFAQAGRNWGLLGSNLYAQRQDFGGAYGYAAARRTTEILGFDRALRTTGAVFSCAWAGAQLVKGGHRLWVAANAPRRVRKLTDCARYFS